MEVKISAKRLHELESKEFKLDELERWGVNEWEWYTSALSAWNKKNALDNLIEDQIDEIHDLMVGGVDYDFPAGRECGISLTLNSYGEGSIKQLLQSFVDKCKEIERGQWVKYL